MAGSRGASYSDGSFEAGAEFDPLGVDVGRFDPFIVPTLEPVMSELPSLLAGPGVPSGRCAWDGIPILCDQAVALGEGAAVQCPDNDCGPRRSGGEWRPFAPEAGAGAKHTGIGGAGWVDAWEEYFVPGDTNDTYDEASGLFRDGGVSGVINVGYFVGGASGGGAPFAVGITPQDSGKPSMDPARSSGGCLTYGMLVNKHQDQFEKAWRDTARSGKENGGWIFHDSQENSLKLFRASEGDKDSMPNELAEFTERQRQLLQTGHAITFVVQFHTHPSRSPHPSRYRDTSNIYEPAVKRLAAKTPLGIIIYGPGQYSYYDEDGEILLTEEKLNECREAALPRPHHLFERPFCRGDIALRAGRELDGLPLFIHHTVEILTCLPDFNAGLIHPEGRAAHLQMLTYSFIDFRRVPPDPAVRRRVIYVEAALPHHLRDIAI